MVPDSAPHMPFYSCHNHLGRSKLDAFIHSGASRNFIDETLEKELWLPMSIQSIHPMYGLPLRSGPTAT